MFSLAADRVAERSHASGQARARCLPVDAARFRAPHVDESRGPGLVEPVLERFERPVTTRERFRSRAAMTETTSAANGRRAVFSPHVPPEIDDVDVRRRCGLECAQTRAGPDDGVLLGS